MVVPGDILINRVFSTPVAWPVVTMETDGQTNPVRRDCMVLALSAHYIMMIRPQQALPLVRIYWKPFIFKYIFKMQDMPTSSCNIIRKKTKFHRISSKFKFFVETSTWWMPDTQSWPFYIGSKRGKLQACPHRPVLHPFPWRWRSMENPLFAWPRQWKLQMRPRHKFTCGSTWNSNCS